LHPYSDLKKLPPHVVGEIGRLLVSAELLKYGLTVARPEVDIGYDLVSISGTKLCRLQVKTKHTGNPFANEQFSIRRRRRTVTAEGNGRLTYGKDELDAFVFASLLTGSFWIVPADSIDLSAHKITMRPVSQWRDAWHLLKGANTDAA